MSHIDPLFRDQLRNHEIQPGESAWERIQAATQVKKERRLGFWIPAVAAGLAIVIVSGVALLRNPGNPATGNAVAIDTTRATELPARYPAIRTYPQEKQALTQNSEAQQTSELLQASQEHEKIASLDQPALQAARAAQNKNSGKTLKAGKRKAQARPLSAEQDPDMHTDPAQSPVFAQENKAPQSADPTYSNDLNTLPLYKPRTTTIEDFAEVDILPLDQQEIAALPATEEKPRNPQNRIRIESYVTREDLIAAADDTPKVIAQGRKWLQLAERKVESLAQQIKLPFNL